VCRFGPNRKKRFKKCYEKSVSCLVVSLVLFLLLYFPVSVFAQEDNVSLRIWGQASPFISGEAGSGSGAPDYADVFIFKE